MRGAYTAEYDNEIYVRMDCDDTAYSDEYNSYIDAHTDAIEDAVGKLAMARYDRIYSESADEIAKARTQLEEKITDAQADLDEAYDNLQKSEEELDKNQQELDDNRKAMELMGISTDGIFDDAQAQLDAAKEQIEDGYAEYNEGLRRLKQSVWMPRVRLQMLSKNWMSLKLRKYIYLAGIPMSAMQALTMTAIL